MREVDNPRQHIHFSPYFNYKTMPPGLVTTLSKEEEDRLITIINTGSKSESAKAKKTLINLTQFTVGAVASKYANRFVSFDKLMKAGNQGLRQAVNHYQTNPKYKFSTYAVWWIKKYIEKALDLDAADMLQEDLIRSQNEND